MNGTLLALIICCVVCIPTLTSVLVLLIKTFKDPANVVSINNKIYLSIDGETTISNIHTALRNLTFLAKDTNALNAKYYLESANYLNDIWKKAEQESIKMLDAKKKKKEEEGK